MKTRHLAQGLAALGRRGDSTLVHMQPQEVAGLQALARANGTTLTTNPDTGLPEAFNLGGVFKSMLPVAAGFGASALSGGAMSPMMAGILAGSATGALTNKQDPLMGALMGGMGGYGGANIASSFLPAATSNAGVNLGANAAANTIGGAGVQIPSTALDSGLSSLGLNTADEVAKSSAMQSIGSSIVPSAVAPTTVGEGVKAAMADPSKYLSSIGGASGAAKLYGFPLAGAALGGLEPSDLNPTFDPTKVNSQQQYDPYARLNLGSGSSESGSGLRLLASGGPVSFAAGASVQPSYNTIFSRSNQPYGVYGRQGSIADLIQAQRAQRAPVPAPNVGMYGGRGMNLNTPGLNPRAAAMRFADGGTIRSGGIADLYGASDAQIGPPISDSGYGLNRLSTLAAEQAQNKAGSGQFASGGTPMLENDGFVIPADVVFYAGGHSTVEGQKKFAAKYGGVPITGPGNGLSDDIPTTIEGQQPARVADGEVYIPRQNVEAAGGAKKFYRLMDKVRQQAHGSKKQARAAKV